MNDISIRSVAVDPQSNAGRASGSRRTENVGLTGAALRPRVEYQEHDLASVRVGGA
jgi:hypothetical protein